MTIWKLFLHRRLTRMEEMASTPPQALSVEPRGACGLACKFCYVKDKTAMEVPVARVTEVLGTYPSVCVLYVYGGDFCDRFQWASDLLDLADRRRLEVRASTGGAGLDQKFAARLNASRVRLQLSLEPVEWGLRVDHAGRPAFDLLSRPAVASLTIPVRVNTVIPTSTKVPYVPLQVYLDRLLALFGHTNFLASYAAEGTDTGQLPDWWADWLGEANWLTSKKYAGKLPLSHFNPDLSAGAVMVNCGATQTPVIGPDGQLYSCHSKAVDMDAAWKRDERHAANVGQWAGMMDNEDCRTCPAHYVCGGICYLRKVGPTNPQCQFMVANFNEWKKSPLAAVQLGAAAAAREAWNTI